jgi:chromosome segregation ATPase
MRPATVTGIGSDTTRFERGRVPDFLRLIDELRALKTRLMGLELARLEEEYDQQRTAAAKAAEKRARTGAPEEILRLQAEARRIVDAELERSKEILNARYQKVDLGLTALGQFLQTVGPLKEWESRLAAQEDRLRKLEDEINIRRKVMTREQEELERDRQLLAAAEESFKKRSQELEARLAQLDVVARAKQLDEIRKDLDGKIAAYDAEMTALVRAREEMNRDTELLGRQRAELDAEAERLREERRQIEQTKAALAREVARELGAALEKFALSLLEGSRPRV